MDGQNKIMTGGSMLVCIACGGYVEELGELPDYDNTCTCNTGKLKLKIQKLESEKAKLEEIIKKCITDKDELKFNNIGKLESDKAELIELLKQVPDYIFCKYNPCDHNDVQECSNCKYNPNILNKFKEK